MRIISSILSLSLMLLVITNNGLGENISKHLQDVSVTIRAEYRAGSGESQGSGVLITREVKLNKDSTEKVKVNFIWTAAHVVAKLRSTREIIDASSGQKKSIIEFQDPSIVQELIENGRRVGEVKMDAQVVKYSNADTGEDLCLLMVRKRGFIDVNTSFYLEDNIVPVGTDLYHVGSLMGQVGANSVTDGIVSQIGRVIQTGQAVSKEMDQSNANSFPGSSGGGVYTKDKGLYIGMLVRGAGESFSLYVPVRRMIKWAKSVDLMWALDPSVEPPSLSELTNIAIEDSGVSFQSKNISNETPVGSSEIKFLIKEKHHRVRFYPCGRIPNCPLVDMTEAMEFHP